MVKINVSVGELLDKISILEIKKNKIKDDTKLKNINKELKLLNMICENLFLENKDQLLKFKQMLYDINLKLWEVEDNIRKKEKDSKFDEIFITLARQVYISNDERFKIKSLINNYFNSDIVEEKEYVDYQ